ncbi:MAG: hypothetical protein ACPKPY_09895 [Nitrososphaeraceae archaeon]
MLGDLIYEGQGRITSKRVLDINGPKIEYSNLGNGTFKENIEVTEMWTARSITLSDNKIYGEGSGIYVAKDGNEQIKAKVYGVGSVSPGKIRYVSGLHFISSATGELSFLNNLFGVNEYEQNDSGNYSHKIWEWK